MPTRKSHLPVDDHLLLSTLPPHREHVRLAVAVLVTLVIGLLFATPFARISVPGSEPFLPAYGAAMLINELLTAVLLLAFYWTEPSRSLLWLAGGYLFSGLLIVPWLLSFPGVFDPEGLLGGGLQATATFAALRRIGFPLFVLVYALDRERSVERAPNRHETRPAVIVGTVGTVTLAVGALTTLVLSGDQWLPRWMVDSQRTTALWNIVPITAALFCAAALFLVWKGRRRSVLDLWLLVVLVSLLIEILLLAGISSGRFSFGWWAGRLYGLLAASVVLFILLAETTTLYARLARSTSAERHVRETRLATMEALSASIAHEVNQPLASMVTNANAGLRWLDKEEPDLGEVRGALLRIVGEGHRAGGVIESIRAMFRKEPRARVAVDINSLILEVVDHWRNKALIDGIVLRLKLGEALPPVSGDPIQLRQVIANLVTNAADALLAVEGSRRLLEVSSGLDGGGAVLVSVADRGEGVAPVLRDHLFEPFFTTKSDGMGMGLMFCRSVVEAHGGRLWMADNAPCGAIFHFTLPAGPADIRAEPDPKP